ncbi:MAG: response regulator, partial [Pseudomonadales bacterium]|nr:response regulator [Pseudomonadales bacterium]
PLKDLRVLLIDDSENDAFFTLRQLRKGGYNATHVRAYNAQTMTEALQEEDWDIVITDHNMPDFDAISAVKLLREFDPDLPAIIVSGAIGEDTAVAAMKAGANDYVMKDNMARLAPAVERELGEAQIRREHKRIQQANLAKSLFLANMSHEIRTPMNGVVGMASLLLDTDLTGEQREYANAIQASADALLEIVNDILDISKIEAGKLEIDPIAFNVRDTLAEVAELLSLKARDKNLPLYLHIDSSVPANVIGDPVRIRQILMNLLTNATKFTQQGYVILKLGCRAVTETFVELVFTVTDTGIGIEQNKLESVFDEYSQADRSTSREYGGTGLGLSICKKLAELMGGTVSAESQAGMGSSFSLELTLPIDDGEMAEPFLTGKRVLIIGVQSIATEILTAILTARGAEVYQCEISQLNGLTEAGQVVLKGDEGSRFYDIVAFGELQTGALFNTFFESDPAKSGIYTAYIPAIGERGDYNQCQEAGFDIYLSHPLSESVVDGVLKKVLRRPYHSQKSLVSRYSLNKSVVESRSNQVSQQHPVLLVEDNAINQKVAARMLEKLGCKVDIADHGQAAVDAWREKEYDLILMDCQMPGMDGYEATRLIRELEADLGQRTPIVALTANVMDRDKRKCTEAGMDDHISKPVSRDTLRKILEHFNLMKSS